MNRRRFRPSLSSLPTRISPTDFPAPVMPAPMVEPTVVESNPWPLGTLGGRIAAAVGAAVQSIRS